MVTVAGLSILSAIPYINDVGRDGTPSEQFSMVTHRIVMREIEICLICFISESTGDIGDRGWCGPKGGYR